MSILRVPFNNGYIYMHRWDNVENVNPRDYIIMNNTQSFIIKYLPSIDRCLGKCPQWLYESLKRSFCNKAIGLLLYSVANTNSIKPFDTIINDNLKKHQQETLLKGICLSPFAIMSIFAYAGSKGYTLSHYSFNEKIGKDEPIIAFKRSNGEIISNCTSISEEELKWHIENDELINAFILCKGSKWFCLCQRKKGILGKEPGRFGKEPHFHFISDAYNKTIQDVIRTLKGGELPHPAYHIKLTDYL